MANHFAKTHSIQEKASPPGSHKDFLNDRKTGQYNDRPIGLLPFRVQI